LLTCYSENEKILFNLLLKWLFNAICDVLFWRFVILFFIFLVISYSNVEVYDLEGVCYNFCFSFVFRCFFKSVFDLFLMFLIILTYWCLNLFLNIFKSEIILKIITISNKPNLVNKQTRFYLITRYEDTS